MNESVISRIVDQASQVSSEDFAPSFSEEALALEFASHHMSDLRYVAAWSKWLRWDGARWNIDNTRTVFDLARQLCRSAAAQANKNQRAIASSRTRGAIVMLAGEDRRIAATVDQWDADPWLLNTPTGVVDLRTGTVRENDPANYMTKITAVGPSGDCPIWGEFLRAVTGEDPLLERFLQRVCGYALTGITTEHALFFIHGLGANGKSVFLSTIAGLLGDYHRTAPIETFTSSHIDRHPTELAMLRGARLVTAIETEEGRAWAESRIKALTGGDRIAARFMRQDFFEYFPQFKLVIGGNHRPSLRSADEAIRRRMHLVPFGVTIPLKERDPELAEKLKQEWPGILAWAIEGCKDWQAQGLTPPDKVTAATHEYLANEDTMHSWLDECCIKSNQSWSAVGELFESYKGWAEASGEHAGTIRRFSQRLEAHGFQSSRRDRRGYIGLEIRDRL